MGNSSAELWRVGEWGGGLWTEGGSSPESNPTGDGKFITCWRKEITFFRFPNTWKCLWGFSKRQCWAEDTASANSFIIHEFSAAYPRLNHDSCRVVKGWSVYIIPSACSGSIQRGFTTISGCTDFPPQPQGSLFSFINSLNLQIFSHLNQEKHETR